ncbi:MAG: hypothetical protein LBQ61_08005 [Spirochaetales bacterium]|jgi:hypothetical protein|nr:hypothetical protein [Spirochaetales bacterium]
MNEVEKKIHDDWFEIKEKFGNVFSIDQYFNFPPEELEQMCQDLRISVDEGVLQYKISFVNSAINFIDALKFDTKQFSELTKYSFHAGKVLYLILLQRLYCAGNSRMDWGKKDAGQRQKIQETDLKTIWADFLVLVQEQPAIVQKPEAKTLILNFKLYQKEIRQFNNLRGNIPKEKLPAFLANSTKTLQDLNKRIEENYRKLLAGLAASDSYSREDLRNYNLSGLAPNFVRQALKCSEVRSALAFAGNERFQIRNILASCSRILQELKQEFLKEEASYRDISGFAGGHLVLAKSFAALLVARIEKNIASRV